MSLLAVVATKNDEKRLVEDHGVAISSPWGGAHHRDGHPLGTLLKIISSHSMYFSLTFPNETKDEAK